MRTAVAIASLRPSVVTLTGGEPLLVPGLPGLVSELAGHGILVGVATSGMSLDADRAAELRRAGVRRFEIQLPAADPETYRRLTGVDGFSPAKAAMLAAVASGAGLTVSHVMTRANPGTAAGVIELAFALGAEAVALNRFVPGGEGLRNAAELTLFPEDLSSALAEADEAARRFPVPVHVTIPVEDCLHPHADLPNLRFSPCVCGGTKWAVDPWGRLRVCEQSPEILGFLLEHPFDAWVRHPSVAAFRSAARTPSCGSRPACPACGGGCRFLGEASVPLPAPPREWYFPGLCIRPVAAPDGQPEKMEI